MIAYGGYCSSLQRMLRGAGSRGAGAIFTEADRELLRTLTHQSAIAIANARVYYVLKETNAAWRTALRKVELLEHVKTHLGKFVPTSVLQEFKNVREPVVVYEVLAQRAVDALVST